MNNLFNYFDKVIFLTLSDSYDRHKNIKYHINKFNIINSYIYYSTKLPEIYLKCSNLFPTLKSEYYDNMNNKYVYANNFSVSINHLNIIKICYELGYKNILICEDDITLIDYKEHNNLIYNTILENIPKDYDIIKFNNDCTKQEILNVNDLKQPIFHKLSYNNNITNYGTSFYALSRNGMKKYIDYLLITNELSEDLIFNRLLKNTNMNIYAMYKKITKQSDFESTIL